MSRPASFINISTLKYKAKAGKVRGRGGKTKRGGRGNKGYKARNSKSSRVPAFAGGQTRIVKAFPKLGQQSNPFAHGKLRMRTIGLDKIQLWMDLGRLTSNMTLEDLIKSGVAGKVKDGITLVATGHTALKTAINIQVTKASQGAIAAIESKGGKVSTVYSDAAHVHALLNPSKYLTVPSSVLPSSRKQVEYYLNKDRRGFLAPLAKGKKQADVIDRLIKASNRVKAGGPLLTSPPRKIAVSSQ